MGTLKGGETRASVSVRVGLVMIDGFKSIALL